MTEVHYSSKKSDWETPEDFFREVDAVYHFTLDAAASEQNAKCSRYYTQKENGLEMSWEGETVWLNPPYGRGIGAWVKKAYEEAQAIDTKVVCLLPARTDTKWFHEYCIKGKINFIRGRLKFEGSTYSAPFPSMLVIFEGEQPNVPDR